MSAKDTILKYPRTPHIIGSVLSNGDEENESVPFEQLIGKHLVVEEKIDGGNAGLSISADGELLIQSRGHYLLGHGDWPHFNTLKAWANTWQDALFDVLGSRYIMYGEYMYALHSIYYDMLPHYFMEFDIYDKGFEVFLDTKSRHELLGEFGMDVPTVRVITEGKFETLPELLKTIGLSAFISEKAHEDLKAQLIEKRFPEEERDLLLALNDDRIMEGIYIKWEEKGIVKGRYKFVRPKFIQTIKDGDKHWKDRPIIPNRLLPSVNIYNHR